MNASKRAPGRFWWIFVGVALLGLGTAGCAGDISVPVPEAQARQETVTQLAKATQAQGICYGWQLDGGGGTPLTRGSNLGDNVAIDPQRCPRWVEVRATVNWVAESSEAEDTASVQVRTSPDLNVGPTIEGNLGRFGLDDQAFIDDPAWAIARAALALPLLTAESGAARPAPVPPVPAGAPPPGLPDGGNDLWRDRWVFLVVAVGLLLAAVVLVAIGLVRGRRQRTPAPDR